MIGDEYLTSNTAIAFPFSDNQDIIDWIRNAIVDALFIVPQSDNLDIKCTSISITSHVCSIVININGTSYTLNSTPGAAGFEVVRYAGDVDNLCVVFNSNFISSEEDHSSSFVLYFDSRCVGEDIQRVNKILLATSPTDNNPTEVTGNIVIEQGYNVTEAITDGIVISAVPGSGKGRKPCLCPDNSESTEEDPDDEDEDEYAKLYSDSGIIKIENDTCYDIMPMVTIDGWQTGYIQITNKCVACCSCDQYIEKVRRLQKLAGYVKSAGNGLMAAIEDHNTAVGNFNAGMGGHYGGTSIGWLVTLTALKKNPSVGSSKGKLHIRAVATISNTTLHAGRLTISAFGVRHGENDSTEFGDINWFMIGSKLGGSDSHGNSLPQGDQYIEVAAGKTVKITGTCSIPGTPDSLIAYIQGSAEVIADPTLPPDPETSYSITKEVSF